MDYKKTLNLPDTAFSMRANSGQREPEIQEFWKTENIYEKNLAQRKKAPFILHDGPPYLSSGKIHMGHALNRILKDIVVKYKTLKGHPSPLIFGYDCHGLPIEHEVTKQKKNKAILEDPIAVREACKAFALESLQGQMDNFYRLGLMGNWNSPYLTLDPTYEAAQLRVFADMVDKGYIYKGLKPVYWSVAAQTALAEAEVEYKDHTSHSIYVKMTLKADQVSHLNPVLKDKSIHFVIWTTTPWTLPANLGIALNPAYTYDFLEMEDGEVWVIANKLVETVMPAIGQTPQKVLYQAKGQELENLVCQHPFYDRDSRVILGNHVTAEAGTGCVHTAPGHGMEDFVVGEKYKLGLLSPVDANGVFTEEAPGYTGVFYEKANLPIIEKLKENHKLVHHSTFSHSYPHCWRTKTPLIYRATEQWFASVDDFRSEAIAAIQDVQWIPSSGKDRIENMVTDRTDWCISRQRIWGVPIPAFYRQDTKEAILDKELILHVADQVESQGSNVWWTKSTKELLPEGFHIGDCHDFEKETDIMDVWFDSGTSHSGVLRQRPELSFPADLYLEGSDQHRGWFQSSLLTAMAAYGEAPYRSVLTHGFALDSEGKKMSKSLGNVVEPSKVIQQYGADVLRLWVASVDYTSDMKVSYEILGQLADVYKKIRNTVRFLISNLYDFDPSTDALDYESLSELDRYTLHKLSHVIEDVDNSFNRYAFYRFYQTVQNFCVIDLSNIYFAIVKDILYIEKPDASLRRSVQTVLWEVLKALLGVVTPVLTHLAEDAREKMPAALLKELPESILLGEFPSINKQWRNPELAEKWTSVLDIRDALNLLLEKARADKHIGRSMEAIAFIDHKDEALSNYMQEHIELFRQVFILADLHLKAPLSHEKSLGTSHHEFFDISIQRSTGEKCVRCWVIDPSVGSHSKHSELCGRCAEIVESLPSVTA